MIANFKQKKESRITLLSPAGYLNKLLNIFIFISYKSFNTLKNRELLVCL